jgi:hypothetical protein
MSLGDEWKSDVPEAAYGPYVNCGTRTVPVLVVFRGDPNFS